MDRRTSIITGLTAAATLAATLSAPAEAKEKPHPDLEKVRAILKAHDDAMTNHDLKGVMATLAPKAVIMGSGPGEFWTGDDQIKDAYEHFFQGYDKGEQDFIYHERRGGLSDDMGWMVASGEVKAKKDGKAFAFPINISMTVFRSRGTWKIQAMHFSTLTGNGDSK